MSVAFCQIFEIAELHSMIHVLLLKSLKFSSLILKMSLYKALWPLINSFLIDVWVMDSERTNLTLVLLENNMVPPKKKKRQLL